VTEAACTSPDRYAEFVAFSEKYVATHAGSEESVILTEYEHTSKFILLSEGARTLGRGLRERFAIDRHS
jgi:hypothetical protein